MNTDNNIDKELDAQPAEKSRQRTVYRSSAKYNPFQFPADVQKAEDHGFASRVAKQDDLSKPIKPCECCGRNIDNEQLPLDCDLPDLYHLGCCFPLYFHFKRYCSLLLVIVFVIAGIYSMASNYNTTTDRFINKLAIIHRLEIGDADNLFHQSLVNLAAILGFIFTFQRFRDRQNSIIKECDADQTTPSDYAVRVTGLYDMIYESNEIKTFFENNGFAGEIETPDVKKVVMTYDIDEIIGLQRKRAQLFTQKRKLENKVKKIKGDSEHKGGPEMEKLGEEYQIEAISQDLSTVEAELKELEPSSDGENQQLTRSGVVFVIFETQETAKRIRQKWKISNLKKFFLKICSCLPWCSGYDYEGRVIQVTRAHEPSDILWENLSCHGVDRFKREVKTFVLTVITILIVSGVLFGISVAKGRVKFPLISFISSFLVVMNNSILVILIKKYAADEKHKSYTEYHKSVADKLTYAQFINSAIVPFFVKYIFFELGGTCDGKDQLECAVIVLDQLAYDMFFVFFNNALITPLTYYLDVFYAMKIAKRKKLKKDAEATGMTQSDANLAFEGTNMDVATRYASLVKTVWMTGLYAPLMPICVPISAIAIIIQYKLDKYLLLRRYKSPLQLGKEISKAMIESLEWFTLWLALGNFFVIYWPNHEDGHIDNAEMTCIIGLGISLLHMILPMRKFHKCFKKDKIETTRPEKYSEIKYTFPNDYDRANPVTKAEAEEKLLESYINTIQDENQQKEIRKNLEAMRQYNQNHRMGNFGTYAAQHAGLGMSGQPIMFAPSMQMMGGAPNAGLAGGPMQPQMQQQQQQGYQMPNYAAPVFLDSILPYGGFQSQQYMPPNVYQQQPTQQMDASYRHLQQNMNVQNLQNISHQPQAPYQQQPSFQQGGMMNPQQPMNNYQGGGPNNNMMGQNNFQGQGGGFNQGNMQQPGYQNQMSGGNQGFNQQQSMMGGGNQQFMGNQGGQFQNQNFNNNQQQGGMMNPNNMNQQQYPNNNGANPSSQPSSGPNQNNFFNGNL